MINRIMNLKLDGNCCSQIIMKIGLEGLGRENDEMITAMAGLCDGAHQGEICGTLSAAICLFYLADKELAESLSDELSEWFEDCYGSVRCKEIIDGNPLNKSVICGGLIENTFLKIVELFRDEGIDFSVNTIQ